MGFSTSPNIRSFMFESTETEVGEEDLQSNVLEPVPKVLMVQASFILLVSVVS